MTEQEREEQKEREERERLGSVMALLEKHYDKMDVISLLEVPY